MFSQNKEAEHLQRIFSSIGVRTRYFVEFGFGARQNNTLHFALKYRASGLYMDASRKQCLAAKLFWAFVPWKVRVKQTWIDRANVDSLISEERTGEIDLLSLDVDGNDYWLWQAIQCVSPRVIVVEYNASFGAERAVTVPYDPLFDRHKKHPTGFYHGMSLQAAAKLGYSKGYSLVQCDEDGVNAFFVRDNELNGLRALDPLDAYHPHSNRVSRGYTQEAQQEIVYSLPLVEV
jgi:hypothetical protein